MTHTPSDDPGPNLTFATAAQIADELRRRYDNIILLVEREGPDDDLVECGRYTEGAGAHLLGMAEVFASALRHQLVMSQLESDNLEIDDEFDEGEPE